MNTIRPTFVSIIVTSFITVISLICQSSHTIINIFP